METDTSNLVAIMYKAAAISRDSIISVRKDEDKNYIWIYAATKNIKKCGPSLYIAKVKCPIEMSKYIQEKPILFKKIENYFSQDDNFIGLQLSKMYILIIGGSSWVKLTAQNKEYPILIKEVNKNISKLNMIPVDSSKFMPIIFNKDKYGRTPIKNWKRKIFFDKEVWVYYKFEKSNNEECVGFSILTKLGVISLMREERDGQLTNIDNNFYISLVSIPHRPVLFCPEYMSVLELNITKIKGVKGCLVLGRKDEYLLIPKRR